MEKLIEIRVGIGQIIKKGLENKRMSQAELAKRVGCDKVAISQYVNGKRTPKIDVFVSICKELDIDLNSALTGKYAKAQCSELIPVSVSEILYSLTLLIKSGVLIQEKDYDLYSMDSKRFAIDSQNRLLIEFCADVYKFSDTAYSGVDKIYLDLIHEYDEQYRENEKTNF